MGVTTDTRIYTFLRSCHVLWHAPAKLVSATSQPRDNCGVGLQSSLHTCCSDHSRSFFGYNTKIPRSETHNTHSCVIARQSCFFLFLVWVLYNLTFLSCLSSVAWKGLWMISLFWKGCSFTIWQQSEVEQHTTTGMLARIVLEYYKFWSFSYLVLSLLRQPFTFFMASFCLEKIEHKHSGIPKVTTIIFIRAS